MLRCRPSLPLRQLCSLTRPTTTIVIAKRFLSSTDGLITELGRRGLLADHSGSRAELTDFLKTPRILYCGVDPTAGSLHVGNLLPLLMLLHFRLRGHQAIALLGGATALIGDPSGRDEERPLQAAEQVQDNAKKIEKQLVHFFDSAGAYARRRISFINSQQPVKVLNNLVWWRDLTLIDFLRSTGKSVRLSSMLSKESVKTRMTSSNGISFAEFSYQILQAHDFWHLYNQHRCRIQIGGSDQWGNIVAGMDVIARLESETRASDDERAYGVTTPLLISSSGQKFGKSTGNAIWLDREKTSVFDFYQARITSHPAGITTNTQDLHKFFLRSTDADVENYLNLFTLLDPKEIENIMISHKSRPEKRSAQRLLANEVTEMIHGEIGLTQAQAATHLLFDTELSNVRAQDAVEALKYDPRYHALEDKELIGMPLTKLASLSGLTHSRAEAVRLVEAGGLYLNNVAVSALDRRLQVEDLLEQRIAILRAGKDSHVILALK